MILSPSEYANASAYDLLAAAANGHVGFDHRWLRALLDKSDEGIEDILRFSLEERPDDRIDLEDDFLRIFRHLRTPRSIPFLTACARRRDFEFPDELTQIFMELGESAVEPLLAMREEAKDPHDVISTLAACRVRDPRILDLLLKELETDKLDGAIVLGLYGDPAARPALEKAMAEATGPDDEWLHKQLELALEEIGEGHEPEPPEAFDLWAEYAENDDPAFEILEARELVEFLDSPEADYRRYAAVAFATEELTDKTRIKLFNIARHDPEARVRGAAWQALNGALKQPEVRKAMLEKLVDEDAPLQERAGALIGMASEADDTVVRERMVEFYDRPETRADALAAMWHSLDRSFSGYFPPHLDDSDPEIQRQAIWGIGWLGIAAQVGKLQDLFEEEDSREVALYAYALAAPSDNTPARIRALFKKIEDLAGGLSESEGMLVQHALDDRMMLHGHEPVFEHEHDEEHHHHPEERAETESPNEAASGSKPGRNDPCPCGSGKKYKKCCGK
jgi:hypothetical protein